MASPGPACGADIAYGEFLAAECASCHQGDDPNEKIPPLRLLSPERLAELLEQYREGKRDNAAMRAVAASLGQAEVEALAAYFAGRS